MGKCVQWYCRFLHVASAEERTYETLGVMSPAMRDEALRTLQVPGISGNFKAKRQLPVQDLQIPAPHDQAGGGG